jgi:hypothetical protein
MLRVVDGKTNEVSPFMRYLNQHHKPPYHGDFNMDAINACKIAAEKVNRSSKKNSKTYVSHGLHAITYKPFSKSQKLHVDSTDENKTALQSTSNSTRLTHVIQVPQCVQHIKNLEQLSVYIKQQSSLLMDHPCYPDISLCIASLDPVYKIPQNDTIEQYSSLLILPCLWKDEKVKIADAGPYIAQLPEPPKKKKKKTSTETESAEAPEETAQKPASKMVRAEDARLKSDFMDSNSKMNMGDMLVVGGGLPHRGIVDPGHSKLFYNLEPKNAPKEPYEHQSQVDTLEVWVMLGAEIFEKLEVSHRQTFLCHICFAYAIALCNECPVYSRYRHMGILYLYFQSIERALFSKHKTLDFLEDDPTKLFVLDEVASEGSEFAKYSMIEPLVTMLSDMYRFTLSNKWDCVANLFTDNAKPLNIKKFLVMNTETGKTRVNNNKEVSMNFSSGNLELHVAESVNQKTSSLQPCSLIDQSMLMLDHANKKKNYYISVQVFEDDVSSKKDCGEQSTAKGAHGPNLVQDDLNETEDSGDTLYLNSNAFGSIPSVDDSNTEQNLSHYGVSLLEIKPGTKISPMATKITRKMCRNMNIVQIVQKSVKNKATT